LNVWIYVDTVKLRSSSGQLRSACSRIVSYPRTSRSQKSHSFSANPWFRTVPFSEKSCEKEHQGTAQIGPHSEGSTPRYEPSKSKLKISAYNRATAVPRASEAGPARTTVSKNHNVVTFLHFFKSTPHISLAVSSWPMIYGGYFAPRYHWP